MVAALKKKQGDSMSVRWVADVLISSWALAKGSRIPLPSNQGMLDRALCEAIKDGNFPSEFKKLRFVQTRVGMRCSELNSVLSWAQAMGYTSDSNPTYEETYAKPSVEAARIILDELGIEIDLAKRWGEALANAISKEQYASQEAEAN